MSATPIQKTFETGNRLIIKRKIDMEFLPMGYGTSEEIIQKCHPKNWVLILDEDAAASGGPDCWFLANGSVDETTEQYRASGGTVSEVFTTADLDADDVYESFQNPEKCKELVWMLLNSGLLPEILKQRADFVEDGVS